jgi:hypothetical protein
LIRRPYDATRGAESEIEKAETVIDSRASSPLADVATTVTWWWPAAKRCRKAAPSPAATPSTSQRYETASPDAVSVESSGATPV